MRAHFVFAPALLALAYVSAACAARAEEPSVSDAPAAEASGTVAYIPQVLGSPLLPVGRPDPADTRALLTAISAYEAQDKRQNLAALEAFARQSPASAWTPSLWVGLGRAYYDQGRYSRALENYEQAFRLTKDVEADGAAHIHSLAGALYAKMLARVGRRDELKAFFAEEKGARPTSGEALDLVSQARGGLWGMNQRPELSFRCGSMALLNVANVAKPSGFTPDPLVDTPSPVRGFSLDELVALGSRAGFPVRALKRTRTDAEFPVPAVVHWRIGHYAAITERSGDRYMVTDPTFGENRRTLMSADALAEECSGFVLVPADATPPPGWGTASAKETAEIRGRGFPLDSDKQATTVNDKKCPECPEGGGTNPQMAGYSFNAMLVSLNITDTPIEYYPPLGAPHVFTVSYNERETMQPNAATHGNFSSKWSWSWSGSLTVTNFYSETADPGDIDVSMPGGGGYTFKKDTFTQGTATTENGRTKTPITYVSKYQRDTRIRLTRSGVVNGKYTPPYVLEYPDGSKAEYGRVSDFGTSRRYFLSRLIDPQGNATRLVYDQNLRLTQIIPPSATTTAETPTTIQYDTDPVAFYNNPHLITKITTPDGRSARFTYDQHGTKLVATTDTLGMSSVFEYGDAANAQRITKLHTPYGTTSFRFGESADMSQPTRFRWIEATDPSDATERIEFNDGHAGYNTSLTGIPYALPTDELPAMKLENSHQNQVNTFYWDKRAYALTSFASRTTDAARGLPGTVADYAKADVTHWMVETNFVVSRLPQWERKAGENYVFYNYQKNDPTAAFATWSAWVSDSQARFAPTADESARVSVIGRLVPDPEGGSSLVTQLERFAYNDAGRLTRHVDPVGRETLYYYDASLVNLTRVDQVATRGATPLASNWSVLPLPAGWTTQTLASFTYDTTYPNLVKIHTDAARTTTTYAYNNRGQVSSVTEAYAGNSRATTFQYSPTGLPGAATGVTAGYLAYVDGPLAGTQDRQTFEWQNGALKTHTDESGYATTITARDAWLRPLAITYPDGSESFDYEETPHPAGPPDEEAFPTAPSLGHLSYAVPDLSGLRLHRLARHTARDGQSYYYRYDDLARPTSVRDAIGAAMLKQSWCACGALEWFTDRKGQQTSFSYYDDGRLWKRTFPSVSGQSENVITYAYDIAGRLASMTNARGQTGSYRYTLDGRPRALLYDSHTTSTFYTYDPIHPRLTLAEEKRAYGSPVSYAFESAILYYYHAITPEASYGAGLLANVQRSYNNHLFSPRISYGYDGYGRRVSRTHNSWTPSQIFYSVTESYAYDYADRLTTKSIPNFGDFTYSYDAGSGRLKSLTRTGGLSVTYDYYPATQVNALRLGGISWKVASSSASVSTHTYGYKGGLADADSPIQGWRIQYGGMDTEWIFDYSDRPEKELVSAVQTGGPAQLAGAYSYSYDKAGNRRTEQRDSQVTTTEHNARNQATTRTGQGPLLFRAAINPRPAAGPWLNGTIAMEPESADRGGVGDALSAYTYRAWLDLPAGDNVVRIEARDGSGRAALQYHLVTVPAQAERSYVYDNDGNLITVLEDSGSGPVAIRSYGWDARNRLISWGNGASPTDGSFVYDSSGSRLAEKSAGGAILKYALWDGASILAEYTNYNYSIYPAVIHHQEGYSRWLGPTAGTYFYTRDHLGSIRELADVNNNIVARYAYDPFGRRYQTAGIESADIGYTGHYYHAPTGLWLTHFRAYDAEMGRWLSRDPIGENGGMNLYGYVANNPVNSVDLLGLVDVNAFAKKEPLYERAMFVPYDPGAINVGGHGLPGVMFGPKGGPLSMKDLARVIKRLDHYEKGKPIKLLVCHASERPKDGSPSVAEQLAQELGGDNPVIGTKDEVVYERWNLDPHFGPWKIGPAVEIGDTKTYPQNGSPWETFQ